MLTSKSNLAAADRHSYFIPNVLVTSYDENESEVSNNQLNSFSKTKLNHYLSEL